MTFDPPTRLPELTQNWIRSSHGHSTPSLKISCKSVQPFSRNVADKETKKERKKERNRPKTISRPPNNHTKSVQRNKWSSVAYFLWTTRYAYRILDRNSVDIILHNITIHKMTYRQPSGLAVSYNAGEEYDLSVWWIFLLVGLLLADAHIRATQIGLRRRENGRTADLDGWRWIIGIDLNILYTADTLSTCFYRLCLPRDLSVDAATRRNEPSPCRRHLWTYLRQLFYASARHL